jgi:hypothetical protein
VARTAPDADQRAPQGVFRRKRPSRDQARTRTLVRSARDLRGQREEQFVQQVFLEKISDEVRAALDKYPAMGTRRPDGPKDRSSGQPTRSPRDREANPRPKVARSELTGSASGRHDQHGDFPGREDRSGHVEFPVSGHDHVERRRRLAEPKPEGRKLRSHLREDVFRGPEVAGDRPQGSGPDDDGVGHRPQHAHQQAVVGLEPGDFPTPRGARDVQRDDPVQRLGEVPEHVGSPSRSGETKGPVDPGHGARERKARSPTPVEEDLQRRERLHGEGPHNAMNSERSDADSAYWPRHMVVLVDGLPSRTPRIWVQRWCASM